MSEVTAEAEQTTPVEDFPGGFLTVSSDAVVFVVPRSLETRYIPLPTRYRASVYDMFPHDVVEAYTRADVNPQG